LQLNLIALVLLLFAVTSCAPTWLDHPTSGALRRELVEKSKEGLALGRVTKDEPEIQLRFFGGQERRQRLGCCAYSEGALISRNRIVAVDMSSAPRLGAFVNAEPDSLRAAVAGLGGEVVVMDASGIVLARSAIEIRSWIVSLSPNGDRFAFVGALRGHPKTEEGVYVAGFQEQNPRKLMDVTMPRDRPNDPAMLPLIDWSSDGNRVVFSYDGSILSLDVRTGESRKLASGGAARWAPSGDWISYVSMNSEPSLLNTTTGESRVIDPGRGSGSSVEWSPDGKYLLIFETMGGHVPYGCQWVYRVSDGAFMPIPYYGAGKPHPYWIQLNSGGPVGLLRNGR